MRHGNCFTSFSDAAELAGIAETIIRVDADEGRLAQVCERYDSIQKEMQGAFKILGIAA